MNVSTRRIAAAALVGVGAAALILGIGFGYGWLIDHTPWTSRVEDPYAPVVTGGDIVRALGIAASLIALIAVPPAYLSLIAESEHSR